MFSKTKKMDDARGVCCGEATNLWLTMAVVVGFRMDGDSVVLPPCKPVSLYSNIYFHIIA